MPQQEEGRMRGFQLWINLPAREKMKPAGYRDIQPSEIPVAALSGGGSVKVIAGTLHADGGATPGPIQGLTTEPLYFDVALPPFARFAHPVDAGHHVMLYAYEGSLDVGPAGAGRRLKTHSAGILSDGDHVEAAAGEDGARFLLLAGRPLREPVVQYGPFVMNTEEEIRQAILDFQTGQFG
jgi:hypothetical protein